ncbi:unnamed protein product [Sphenostylis stenocarpa]|uniref:Uncharacterized protein n=1 Tax=Sphenostylis stenocarpa TaxID=92480 RepID=A0AA86V790_9FABA|nr:unnamed protein product [Sphenostylis stenocarpa]
MRYRIIHLKTSLAILVGKHVGLGSSVCFVGAVRALNPRVAVSDTWEGKVRGVWELSNKWCVRTHSFPPLLWLHMCVLAGCKDPLVPRIGHFTP